MALDSKIQPPSGGIEAVLPNQTTPWYKQAHLVKLNSLILGLVCFQSAIGYDGSLLNGLQSLPQWSEFMNHPSGEWSGFINAIYFIGFFAACPPSSWLANKYGRRLPAFLGFIPLAIGTGLQTGAKTEAEWIAGRFILGIPTAMFATSIPLLITEIAYPSHRSVITALTNCNYFIGGIIAAWSCYGTRNYTDWAWRIPTILQIALPLVALPALILVPESPRWLVSVGREDAARETLGKLHAGGDANHPLVDFELHEITTAIESEKQAEKSSSYASLVSTPAHRRRLFITASLAIYSQWVGNGVVSYYLSTVLATVGITSVTDQTLIMGCLQIWSFLAACAGALCVERLGRRLLLMISCAIMLVSFILITAMSGSFAQTGSRSVGITMIPFVFLFNAGYAVAITPLQVAYPLELWPFQLRGRGISAAWMIMILALIFNVFVNPIALSAIGWKYYIVYVVLLVSYGFVIFFFYPETRGRTLEEISVIFGDAPEGLYSDELDTKQVIEKADVKHLD
ncbi:general substrate transporter [Fusarium redolens]|uniref:General substrate transporter n=1 Tax=Fusarium redolens TaxID=48865 RepID=A0A9P9GDJ5_FUSRE|nr:general substrate transporter [Fusarium redolens]KAH7237061.1 general substrate transporter [Fusarium redolens]